MDSANPLSIDIFLWYFQSLKEASFDQSLYFLFWTIGTTLALGLNLYSPNLSNQSRYFNLMGQ